MQADLRRARLLDGLGEELRESLWAVLDTSLVDEEAAAVGPRRAEAQPFLALASEMVSLDDDGRWRQQQLSMTLRDHLFVVR